MPASSAWRHTGSSPMWLGEWSLGQPLGDQQRGGAHRDRLAGHRRRAVEVGQRHVAGGQQPGVDGAELDHAAVVGAGGAVGEVEVAARARGAAGARC